MKIYGGLVERAELRKLRGKRSTMQGNNAQFKAEAGKRWSMNGRYCDWAGPGHGMGEMCMLSPQRELGPLGT